MKYSKPTKNNGRLESVEIYEGESIETKCARILENGEPITDTAPIIYTAKEDGVLPVTISVQTDSISRWTHMIKSQEIRQKRK